MHFSVVSCMRNEAIFLLEWIAYYKLMGFETIAIATNDCTDGTDEILDRLSAHDPSIHHIKNEVAPGESPQINGMKRVFEAPFTKDTDYMLHCDSDEFLVLNEPVSSLPDLIEATENPDCIALAWRAFGDSGNVTWDGGLVTEKCDLSIHTIRQHIAFHKSFFKPARFKRAIDHMPKEPVSEDVRLVNSKGERFDQSILMHPTRARFRTMAPEQFTWENACIHHYAIRARDVFLMKNLRGDGMAHDTTKYHINSGFWRRQNKNTVRKAMPVQILNGMKAQIERYRQVEDIRALETKALDAFIQNCKTYLTPERIEQLTIK